MIVLNGGPRIEISEAVLFPYDDRTIPFRYRLQIGLVEGVNPYKGHRVAMERGGPGTPDSRVVKYYGAVCQVEDELRLWYLGHGDIDGEPTPAQVCYAVSTDGVNWEKPELGLVEFNGSKRNNLLPFEAPGTPGSCSVLYDPEDPDPARRFKMVTEDNPYYITASYSHDGIHWKEGPNNPILKHNAVEPTGLIRFNGCYLLNGQGGNVGTKRALVTFVSWDFDNWSDAVVLGLRRDRHPYRQIAGCHAGEQVHLGAGLWDRGNVLIGVYGMWHGETNDRRFTSMDLGFLVSNDALHFTEPIPDFKFIAAYEIEKEGTDLPHPRAGPGVRQRRRRVPRLVLELAGRRPARGALPARPPRLFRGRARPQAQPAAERGHPSALLAGAHRRHGAGVRRTPLHLLSHRSQGLTGFGVRQRPGTVAAEPAHRRAAGRAHAAASRVRQGRLPSRCRRAADAGRLEGKADPGGNRLSRAGADQLGGGASRGRVPVRGLRGRMTVEVERRIHQYLSYPCRK